MRELTPDEIAIVAGGDAITYEWGTYVGNALGKAWRPGPNMRGLTKPPPPSSLELNRTLEGDAVPVALQYLRRYATCYATNPISCAEMATTS